MSLLKQVMYKNQFISPIGSNFLITISMGFFALKIVF